VGLIVGILLDALGLGFTSIAAVCELQLLLEKSVVAGGKIATHRHVRVVLTSIGRPRNLNSVGIGIASYHAQSTSINDISSCLRLMLLPLWITLKLIFVCKVLKLGQGANVANRVVGC